MLPGFPRFCSLLYPQYGIVHSMKQFHADFPNNVTPHNIQIRIPVYRNTYRSYITIVLDSMME